jgi:hypothetical protein
LTLTGGLLGGAGGWTEGVILIILAQNILRWLSLFQTYISKGQMSSLSTSYFLTVFVFFGGNLSLASFQNPSHFFIFFLRPGTKRKSPIPPVPVRGGRTLISDPAPFRLFPERPDG